MSKFMKGVLSALVALLLFASCTSGSSHDSWSGVYDFFDREGFNVDGMRIISLTNSGNSCQYEADAKHEVVVVTAKKGDNVMQIFVLAGDNHELKQVLDFVEVAPPAQTEKVFDLGYGESVVGHFQYSVVEELFICEEYPCNYMVLSDLYVLGEYDDNGAVTEALPTKRENLRLVKQNRGNAIISKSISIDERGLLFLPADSKFGYVESPALICGRWCYDADLESMYKLAEDAPYNLPYCIEEAEIRKWVIPLSSEVVMQLRTEVSVARSECIGKCCVWVRCQNYRTGEQLMNEVLYLNATDDKYTDAYIYDKQGNMLYFGVDAVLVSGQQTTYNFVVDTKNFTIKTV